jgi:hypothetical protein
VDEAAVVPWKNTKIHCLLLGVTIPVLPGYPSQIVPVGVSYKRVPPVQLSETEVQELGLLERFYEQIGSMKELRTLELRARLATDPSPDPSPDPGSRRWNLGRDSSLRCSIWKTQTRLPLVALWTDPVGGAARLCLFDNTRVQGHIRPARCEMDERETAQLTSRRVLHQGQQVDQTVRVVGQAA